MIRVLSPQNSFIQMGGTGTITSCNFASINLCLPVYQDDDIYFQFIAQTDTAEEADELCDLTNSLVDVGIARACGEEFSLLFTQKPDRYRISETQILYNWSYGLPGFETVAGVGDCFVIKVIVNEIEACSNCLQRIGSDCHTSVLEYGNEDNAFGFNYCGSGAVEESADVACNPTFISFINQSTLAIPYTASMQTKYGAVPTIKVWIYEGLELVNMSVRQAFDGYPPTMINIDLGGPATGYVKIS